MKTTPKELLAWVIPGCFAILANLGILAILRPVYPADGSLAIVMMLTGIVLGCLSACLSIFICEEVIKR